MTYRLTLFSLYLLLAACSSAAPSPPTVTPPPQATAIALGTAAPSTLPAVVARQERLRAALATAPYVLLLNGLDAPADAAQRAAANDARVHAATRTADDQPLRAEVFTVAQARPGDLPAALAGQCAGCWRVVIYGAPTNTTITVIVAADGQVRDVQALAGAQPEIPADLADLATQIALTDPQVQGMIAVAPSTALATMSATKTALNGSACERSKHLCVAPTFIWGDIALWVIVDLTDYRVVGAEWTALGGSTRRTLSETAMQNAVVAPFCDTAQAVRQGDWTFTYLLTSSDGLEVRDVAYQGRPVLTSAKIVDWHVSYSSRQGFGYSDAIGCPVFSQAAVVPFNPPELLTAPDGSLTLRITFQSADWPLPCNYRYVNEFVFTPEGRVQVNGANEGRGCGIDGTYRPIFRLQLPGLTTGLSVANERWPSERWAALTPAAPVTMTADTDVSALTLAPTWGDALDGYVYATVARPEEGDGDLSSIGTCCALDERQGPEAFIGLPGSPGPGEALAEAGLTLWYVPRITNAERARCWADSRLQDGLFVPEIWPCVTGISVQAK